jgi:hypothetical protein
MKTRLELIGKIAISIGVSMLMIAIMLRMVSTGLEPANRPQIFTVLRNTSLSLVGLYLFFALIQAFFRAIRYRLIIAAGNEKDVPSVFHTYLVTLCRNMFVDLLPARIGELSYIAMMNRGYNVSGKKGSPLKKVIKTNIHRIFEKNVYWIIGDISTAMI